MKTDIKDRNNRTIGYIVDEGSNKRVEDSRGNLLGRYIAGGNKTIDRNGMLVGYGDRLQSLVS
jgi:hypothetical protein